MFAKYRIFWKLWNRRMIAKKIFYLAFNDAGRELRDNSFDRVRTGPSSGREKLHTDRAAFHNEAFLDSWRNNAHKRRSERETLGKHHMKKYVRYIELPHVRGQFTFRIDLVQSHVPLEQIVVYQLRGERRLQSILRPLNLA